MFHKTLSFRTSLTAVPRGARRCYRWFPWLGQARGPGKAVVSNSAAAAAAAEAAAEAAAAAAAARKLARRDPLC